MFMMVAILTTSSMSGMSIDPTSMSPEQMMGMLSSSFFDHIWIIAILSLLTFFLITVIQAYFTAGAIGMARTASEKGTTVLNDMFRSARENVFNLLLVKILISLIVLAGVIFIVPGILAVGDIQTLISNPGDSIANTILLAFGLLVWTLYAIIASIAFTFVEYSLVVDRLDPISAIENGFRCLMDNKLDVIVMWLVLISISVITSVIGEMMSSIKFFESFWTFADLFISFAVIQPLTAVWWTRMYLDRTGKELYNIDDLLNYP